jgi:hydrogenase small subunit
MGCKGPAATYNCPIVRWNDGTNWPIGAGHGCVACASPRFWEAMSPFYERLPNVKMFGVDVDAQTIGLAAIGRVRRHRVHVGAAPATGAERRPQADGTVVMEDAPSPDAPPPDEAGSTPAGQA